MLKKNRETDSFTVSFLDVASCGFGAMIILLMITKNSDPVTLEISDLTPEATVMFQKTALTTPSLWLKRSVRNNFGK